MLSGIFPAIIGVTVLEENTALKVKMKNDDFNQRELKEFLMAAKPASKPDPTGIQAFFNGKGGNK